MFFFRADSNNTIASGHIMRCLAIAQILKKNGEKVQFLIADNNPSSILCEAGIEYTILDSDWQNLMTDVDKVIDILKREKGAILLVDTYKATKEYIEKLKPFCRIAYLGSKPEFLGELDFLINYSTDINYQFYKDNYGDNTKLLLGPAYAPLREEFQGVEHIYNDKIKRIMLTTGNTDQNHIVADILYKLLPVAKKENIVLEVVIGRMFDNKEQLYKDYDGISNVHLNENVADMSVLMKQCDMAISANGTTVYELSAMGVPTISFAMVKEQVKSAEKLYNLGVIDYCGESYIDQELVTNNIREKVRYYADHYQNLVEMAKKAKCLMDGNGCRRIVNALLDI